MQNEILHETQPRSLVRKVFFTGTTAVLKGQAMCYDRDYGTATDGDMDDAGRRGNYVQLPDNTNNLAFAGVAAYACQANASGQFIDIFEPGSICEVLVSIATTINSTRLSACLVGSSGVAGVSGLFVAAGHKGRGTAVALSSRAAITTATEGVVSNNLAGSATVAADGVTVTSVGSFTNAAAGDRLIVVGGANTTAGTASVTRGVYTINSVTSADVVVLTAACCTSASDIAFYCIRGTPTVWAYLEDGDESGLVEYLTPIDNTAVQHMISGRTVIVGGYGLTAGDVTATLANGTFIGQLKSFLLMAALGTNDYLVTVTAGEQLDGSTDLASMEFDAQNDTSTLEWFGTRWRLMENQGTGLA